MNFWNKLAPIYKILIVFGTIMIVLMLIIGYLIATMTRCYKYDSEIVIGRNLTNSVNKQLPNEIFNYLSEIRDKEICPNCCYFPSKFINIRHYYRSKNVTFEDSLVQKIIIYNQELGQNVRKANIKEFNSNILLNDGFFEQNLLDAKTFQKILSSYVSNNGIENILVFSTNKADSALKFTINTNTYTIFTDIEKLKTEKNKILSNLIKPKGTNIPSILLVFNPILASEVKYITLSGESLQTIRDESYNSTVNFRCDQLNPDSIVWEIQSVDNVTLPVWKGRGNLLSQKVSLIDHSTNGSISIKVTPFKKGFVSKDFNYKILVTPRPTPLTTPSNLIFDQNKAILTCDPVTGATGYHFKIEAGNIEIINARKNVPSISLSRSDVRKIIESNINCTFKAEVFAYNTQTNSDIISGDFQFDTGIPMPPVIEHSRTKVYNSIKWNRVSIFESYWIIISRKPIDANPDPSTFLINQECLENELFIKPDILKSKDNETKIQFYVVVKTILFNKESQGSKELAFQLKDCELNCSIIYCY
jgi:hypothetical protein